LKNRPIFLRPPKSGQLQAERIPLVSDGPRFLQKLLHQSTNSFNENVYFIFKNKFFLWSCSVAGFPPDIEPAAVYFRKVFFGGWLQRNNALTPA
jgi:hypothetical protein